MARKCNVTFILTCGNIQKIDNSADIKQLEEKTSKRDLHKSHHHFQTKMASVIRLLFFGFFPD